jgi:hypothetical protein
VADVVVVLLRRSSRHTDVENLQLAVGVVYDYGGAHFWMTWRSSVGGQPGNSIIHNFNK